MRHRGQEPAGSFHSISWERARGIFGNPKPPQKIWERQFDYDDELLAGLAK